MSGRLFAIVVLLTAVVAGLAILPRLAPAPHTAQPVDLAPFQAKVVASEAAWKVDEVDGMIRIAPPPGSDVYILASRFEWRPLLRLTTGARYRLHLTSSDVLHGLGVPSLGWRFEAPPGYEQVADIIAPTTPGSHVLLCDEFCGEGHHLMFAHIEVVAP